MFSGNSSSKREEERRSLKLEHRSTTKKIVLRVRRYYLKHRATRNLAQWSNHTTSHVRLNVALNDIGSSYYYYYYTLLLLRATISYYYTATTTSTTAIHYCHYFPYSHSSHPNLRSIVSVRHIAPWAQRFTVRKDKSGRLRIIFIPNDCHLLVLTAC